MTRKRPGAPRGAGAIVKRTNRPQLPGGLPSKAEITEYINENPGRVGTREIARAFNVSAAGRVELKRLLQEMRGEGVSKNAAQPSCGARTQPKVQVLEITGRDIDGELLAQPFEWRGVTLAPRILIVPGEGEGARPAGIGDKVLARLTPADDGYEARVIRHLGRAAEPAARRVLGVFQADRRQNLVRPVEKGRDDIMISRDHTMGAQTGELVQVEMEAGRRYGPPLGKVVERLGLVNDARSVSLIAIYEHGIPVEFPPAALLEADAATPPRLGKGTDLRDLPLVTIDPPDARDHDDAVWAGADNDPKNPDGWVVIVAIADVAHYVKPGSALDREALKRGNSSYFPDRVVPMLPEALSAGLCSLVHDEDRAVLAVRMRLDAKGRKLDHEFIRGLMNSRASLTYAQMQAAQDGAPDAVTGPLLDSVIRPLYGAYAALAAARDARHPLALELPERRIELGDDGRVQAIRMAERLEAHRLIEECMIAANVCAAETLEKKTAPCMYRIHAEPALAKLESLRDFLKSLDYTLARGQVLKPELFNRILEKARGTEHAPVVNEVILRAQSQAAYSPENVGHFGLSLPRYAHFTSPIRRYADVLVHRALIRACHLGDGGLPEGQGHPEFVSIGEEISAHERRSMAAERDSSDRYLAAFLSDRIGAEFDGAISGVTRFGLFVRLRDSGADGLIPIRDLGAEYFSHVEAQHALVGDRTGQTFRLGDAVRVRLVEAAPVSGGLRFALADHEAGAAGVRRPSIRSRGAAPGETVRLPGKAPAGKKTASRSGASRKLPGPAGGPPPKTAKGKKIRKAKRVRKKK
ncbi:MAG: ribonuclease R [Alphaproteobacteria bacterium]|nr:ribonuclease R [Alphaproteobacteria bacterium]